MIALAIELSTDVGSVALLRDDLIVWDRTWVEEQVRRQRLFPVIEGLVAAGDLDVAAVDVFVVGTGPGSFSGMRTAAAMAGGLARPDRRAVEGVSSAEALAWAELRAGADSVAVIGDARRNEFWLGQFSMSDGLPRMDGTWIVTPYARLPGSVRARSAVWVSPDWNRIGGRLEALCPPGANLVRERRVPSARDVGMLAAAKRRAGIGRDDPIPIYVHPAVSAAPARDEGH